MNVIGSHEYIPICVVGDVHSRWGLIMDKIRYYKMDNTVIFQVGDFGVGFGYNNPTEPKKERKRLTILNTFLKKRNIFLYVVRGNHDNPMFFDGKHNLSNIVFMQDYSIVEIGDYKILGIGGATSVDRKPNSNFADYRGKWYPGRRDGIDWWSNTEKIVYDEDKLSVIAGIDIVVTHTVPDFIYPTVINENVLKWVEYDPELKDELIEERAVVSRIYQKLNEVNVIKWWLYGHFHQSRSTKHENTKFQLLDVGEFTEVRLDRLS